jgi:hypothetical protein
VRSILINRLLRGTAFMGVLLPLMAVGPAMIPATATAPASVDGILCSEADRLGSECRRTFTRSRSWSAVA